MRRVAVPVEKANPDGLEPAGNEAGHEFLDDGALVQRLFDCAVAQRPLRHPRSRPGEERSAGLAATPMS